MSCCPPGATAYLAAVPTTVGSLKESNGVEFYETGAASSAAIILFPDVWGWNSGRTRALADAFAEQGYRTYVPKVLQPAFEGGTDGDGLPPTFDLGERGDDFMKWVVTVKWDGIDAKVKSLLAYAKKEGADAIGVVGCCWGGWACFETSAMSAGPCPASVAKPSTCERRGDGVGSNASYAIDAISRPISTQTSRSASSSTRPATSSRRTAARSTH